MAAKNKINWKSYVNIGTVIFFLIIIYLAGYVIHYVSRKNLAIYEVSNSEISDTIKGTGIILRKEKLYTTPKDGYINSYLSDGDRVRKKGIVYTIDQTGKIQDEVNRIMKEKGSDNTEETSKILDDLHTFTEGYDDSDFYMVAETENELEHDQLSYTGSLLSKNKEELEKKYGKGCYTEVRSKKTGLVSYNSDGLESLTVDDLTESLFDDRVHMKDLRTKSETKKGTAVYRLTTSQKWKLIVPLTNDEYERIKDLADKGTTTLKITVQKDDFSLTAPFKCFQKDGKGYVQFTFSNYVQQYLNQRYLSVEILLLQGSGLKIPASALVEKKVFRIPVEYLSEGSNQEGKNHVNLIYYDKKGTQKMKQITVKTFDEKDGMVSVISNKLKEGDQLKKVDNASTYSLEKTVSVYGVYTVNAGYAVYNYVNIKERNEDYCIVDADTSEIQLYDRIILNSKSVHENEIIY